MLLLNPLRRRHPHARGRGHSGSAKGRHARFTTTWRYLRPRVGDSQLHVGTDNRPATIANRKRIRCRSGTPNCRRAGLAPGATFPARSACWAQQGPGGLSVPRIGIALYSCRRLSWRVQKPHSVAAAMRGHRSITARPDKPGLLFADQVRRGYRSEICRPIAIPSLLRTRGIGTT